MNPTTYVAGVTSDLARTLGAVDPAAAARLVDVLQSADRTFVAGAGRSALALRAFAMRLMHMGLTAHVAGDTTTPSIGPGDLLLIGSGSGQTGGPAALADRAARVGARVALITAATESPIGTLAEPVVVIPAPPGGTPGNVQPMGALFEQCLLVFLDCVVLSLMDRTDTRPEAMHARHANLE